MLTFKAKIAHLLMKDNNGIDKKPNELHQNYHIMKLNKSNHIIKFANHHLMNLNKATTQ